MRAHGSGREVPCIVVVDKLVCLTLAVGMFKADVMEGSTIVMLD